MATPLVEEPPQGTGRTAAPELTWQAIAGAFVVSAIVSACYPYVILKLGIGPNVSVVSAFLGALLLLVLARKTHGENRLMNNVIQTAGTSAASTAFMCVVAAAVDIAAENSAVQDKLNGITHIDRLPMFLWLSCAGGIGVLFAVLFRRHFMADPQMIFADGVAAAETIVVLDTPGRESRGKIWALGLCGLASALVDFFRDGIDWISGWSPVKRYAPFQTGIEWNLLSVGTGLLVGANVGLSMLAGALIFAGVGQYLLSPESGIARDIVVSEAPPEDRAQVAAVVESGRDWKGLTQGEQTQFKQPAFKRLQQYLNGNYYATVLLWTMWPATAMMIAASLAAVALKWRSIAHSFNQLRLQSRTQSREDVSFSTIVLGSLVLTAALALVQHYYFGMSYVQTCVGVLCSLPLILVCIIILGETNFAPISVMMNGLQAIFAVFWASSVGLNLVAAGIAGTCSSQGQGTTQDYKTGQIVHSTPRILTWVQLAAVPIDAAAVALMYPLLTQLYDVGSEKLPAPTGIKIANMAVLLGEGFSALPRGALLWSAVAAVAGVLLVLGKQRLGWYWLLSPGGIGFGLLLPGTLSIVICIGGVAGWFWWTLSRSTYERYMVTVASGFIAGEALLGGLVIPVMRALGA